MEFVMHALAVLASAGDWLGAHAATIAAFFLPITEFVGRIFPSVKPLTWLVVARKGIDVAIGVIDIILNYVMKILSGVKEFLVDVEKLIDILVPQKLANAPSAEAMQPVQPRAR